MKTTINNKYPNPWVLLVLFWLIVLLCVTAHCNAQKQTAYYDTCYCHVEYIKKYVQQPSTSGKTIKIYAVYNSPDIHELIPVSKTTFEYIKLCDSNGIKPSLGIKLRNGQIHSIIRYRKTYGNRKNKT